MTRLDSIYIVGIILGLCTAPSKAEPTNGTAQAMDTRHGDQTRVVLSGVQELDVEVVSFRETNNRRQSWVFGFQKLTVPEVFTLELLDDDFTTAFIKARPDFMREYYAERLAAIKEYKQWDYVKSVNQHPRFHFKVDASKPIARILEWKQIFSKDAEPPTGGDGKPALQP